MRTIFYGAWLALPLLFFLLALWSMLEGVSKKATADKPGDLLRQGGFVLLCAIIAILIDYYLLEDLYNATSPDWIPLGFYQFMLLPIILLVSAKFIGPSKDIKISKAPKPTQRGKR